MVRLRSCRSQASFSAASTAWTVSSGVRASSAAPGWDATSCSGVETTGRPAARYSRSLIGLTAFVRSLI